MSCLRQVFLELCPCFARLPDYCVPSQGSPGLGSKLLTAPLQIRSTKLEPEPT